MASGEQTAPQLPKCITCPAKQGPPGCHGGHEWTFREGGADPPAAMVLACDVRPAGTMTSWPHKGPPHGREPASLTPGLFFLSAAPCRTGDLSSLSRDPARAPCAGRERSRPLGRQGSPSRIPKLSNWIIRSVFKNNQQSNKSRRALLPPEPHGSGHPFSCIPPPPAGSPAHLPAIWEVPIIWRATVLASVGAEG